MDKIKKVSMSNNDSIFEIPGTKFNKPGCTWGDCNQQCTCQFANLVYQYSLARDYYASHYDIWWPN